MFSASGKITLSYFLDASYRSMIGRMYEHQQYEEKDVRTDRQTETDV